ncbi:LacI family transcriptional regulator [Pseudarthrobacter sp. NamE2]|uniref:LacI family DNA-binding transcriptional regulator n=1 Tax=Pseudarthrobacter sp. NamE2 TaxID=2576838 RepID=UPI0010FEA924|nr:LacI family DNA-binding transcriptional regulator [Pseudarthrobacter sp. NamE2]TLM83582.1 LacI family transcriptional regulator [Pseudarthrobacter sp. NamE2]
MHQVARLAGLSHQTVSRYLQNNDALKAANRQRVEAAIQELGYRPNLVARSMRTRRTGRLAILIPPPSSYSPTRMLAGAVQMAHAAGYASEVVSLEGGAEARTQRMLELADSGQVEGILSLAPLAPTSEEAVAGRAALVVSGDYDDDMRAIGELADSSPVADLIEQLAAQGHRRFLHVAGSQQFASARGRKQVYLDTIERLGLESAGVYDGDWSAESGIEAITQLPNNSGVTAVIAGNDLVAAGVIRGALNRGWQVPGDITVTGWDNNPLGAYLNPTLTTVDVNHEELGRRAMRRLVTAVGGSLPEPAANTPLNTIVWRDSTNTPRW